MSKKLYLRSQNLTQMRQDLHQEQTQRLQQRLTSQQVRYVRLLEMNEQEAEAAVIRELDDNPALALSEEEEPAPAERPERYYPAFRSDSEFDWTPVAADDSVTLYDYLQAQVGELTLPEDVRRTALYILGNLDPNGYLQRSPQAMIDDMAMSEDVEVPSSTMDEALAVVRKLDPPGVGAQDLQHALILQLERMTPSCVRNDALLVLEKGFDLFVMKHLPKLVTRLRLPAERVERAVELIRSLNPKPGSGIGSGRSAMATPVVPDFQIDTTDEGEITVSFNSRIPALAIEESFEQAYHRLQTAARNRNEGDNRFVISRYKDARDFINIIKQRRDTLYSVMTAIISLQKDYFMSCDEKELRPMTLKDVASLINMDVSTVSRATAGKYVATPCGVVPLRFFFSEGYDDADGGKISARSVQAALRELIDKEDKRHPLSDEALCVMLSDRGYEVSRRTVAKYRNRLGFPVARLRRLMQV